MRQRQHAKNYDSIPTVTMEWKNIHNTVKYFTTSINFFSFVVRKLFYDSQIDDYYTLVTHGRRAISNKYIIIYYM